MLTGVVNEYDEPIVTIMLLLSKRDHPIDGVIDTGFNGYLSVPAALVRQSGWQFVGYEPYELASGEIVWESVYIGRVTLDGELRSAFVLESSTDDVLIGTKLLWGKVLTIDFVGRTVAIRDHGE